MNTALKEKIYKVIFEADTRAGKIFDVLLLVVIVISVIAVMLESMTGIEVQYGNLLYIIEWVITICFTLEYLLRIWVARKSIKYMISFYGVIDLLAILPSYLGIFFAGAHGLMIIRTLRLLRIFRLFKLTRYTSAGNTIMLALRNSREKIFVFLFAVLTIVIIIGTLMYLIEGTEHGFSSIPKGIYWAIVTLTTVGYGDLAPETPFGQFIASFVMILGYGIIAVPTGIVTAEITLARYAGNPESVCPDCGKSNDEDASFCKHCGSAVQD